MNGWLYGWKEIAGYVGCHVTTARRYVKRNHLPIRILPNGKAVGIPKEMDEWIRNVKKL